ncbi:MAG TPA: methenyltetrahydromethanopterin cyclohydrolase [Pirellulaceae bacterium]|nr:methenyltetrahydromethanopterin cyclohydrolase [Pirellulaceae bacterium]
MTTSLNERAWHLADQFAADSEHLRASVSQVAGARVIDCGVQASGGLEAGRRLAEICLAGLGEVTIEDGTLETGPAVTVRTDHPVLACMASQYAGWQITGEKFFGMGSGPMRAAACREPLFEHLGYREQAARVVGVLETSKLPTEEVCRKIAEQCGVAPEKLTLLVARTASIAGTVQVVARSVETGLHKLHELGYDLKNIISGFGSAPLPPVAADDLVGIGRTNDAILYGGDVTLWVRDDDARLAQIGPQIPSSASRDYGEPFAAIFQKAGRDFYKIDPLLFSPAAVTLNNLATGKSHRFGQLRPDVLSRSYSEP